MCGDKRSPSLNGRRINPGAKADGWMDDGWKCCCVTCIFLTGLSEGRPNHARKHRPGNCVWTYLHPSWCWRGSSLTAAVLNWRWCFRSEWFYEWITGLSFDPNWSSSTVALIKDQSATPNWMIVDILVSFLLTVFLFLNEKTGNGNSDLKRCH